MLSTGQISIQPTAERTIKTIIDGTEGSVKLSPLTATVVYDSTSLLGSGPAAIYTIDVMNGDVITSVGMDSLDYSNYETKS